MDDVRTQRRGGEKFGYTLPTMPVVTMILADMVWPRPTDRERSTLGDPSDGHLVQMTLEHADPTAAVGSPSLSVVMSTVQHNHLRASASRMHILMHSTATVVETVWAHMRPDCYSPGHVRNQYRP